MDQYQATIRVYNQLGEKYLKAIQTNSPPEIFEFIRLLPKNAYVGCAAGRDAKIFTLHGSRVLGIDATKRFLVAARKNVPQAMFKYLDVRKMRFPKNTFHAIWANAVLLHLAKNEIPRVLHVFRQILKPDGVVHIRVKRGRGESMVAESLSGGQGRFFSFFSKQEMESLVKEAGFTIIRSKLVADELGRKDTKWISIWGRKLLSRR
jgi:SAM-dependent methyltransferase